MAGGRPTKFDPEKGRLVVERLRAGGTRKDCAESVGVWYTTFLDWLEKGQKKKEGEFYDFYEAVMQAEAEAALRNTAILEKAANGYDAGEVTRTVKTVFRTKKSRHPNGMVVEEPVAMQEVTETTVSRREFDWRAAESWLKRRRPDDWAEKVKQEHSGPGGGPLLIKEVIVELPPADDDQAPVPD